MLACHYEVGFFCINGLGEVLVHQDGCGDWTGGEEPFVYGFEPGIYYRTKAGLVKEMYKGRECIHLVSAICETVLLEVSVG